MNTQLLGKLISFKTTEDNPQEIKKGFEYIASLFDVQKFEAKIFEKNDAYSLLVSFKGKDALNPKILLNGHLDVVSAENENQFQLKIEGKKAFGRGMLDMKGMVAILIEVMQEFGGQKNPPDVSLLLSGDEEIGGKNGARFFAKELKMRPQFVLCADGASEKQFEITSKEKGVLWVELSAKGRTAHGAYPWLGENAIEKLFGAIQKIKEFVGQTVPEAWKSTANIGVIETNNKTANKVPDFARAVLDIRFTEELAKTPDELLKNIKRLVPEVGAIAKEKCSLLFVEENNEFLQKFKKTAEKVLNLKIPFSFAHGATDARFFSEVGIPVAIFGAVGENMHANNEWVDLKSLETNKDILLRFLQSY